MRDRDSDKAPSTAVCQIRPRITVAESCAWREDAIHKMTLQPQLQCCEPRRIAACWAAMRRGSGALLALLAGCSSGPVVTDPVAALTTAETKLVQGELAPALALLEAVDSESFTGTDVERYQVALATALTNDGDLWAGFELIRDFEEEHPFSEYRGQIQDLEFEIGRQLMASDWSFLFFASDRDDGRIVLEHFALRYPQHPAAPDVLRLLGEQAFAEGDFTTAQRRFGELVLKHSDSEWAPLAKFRIAMASFQSLVGPDYDRRSMVRAHNELHDFLSEGIENPQFDIEARAALATTREWLGTKHLSIADFYRRVGNQAGEQVHLEKAAASYPETAGGRRAAQRLREELPARNSANPPPAGQGRP